MPIEERRFGSFGRFDPEVLKKSIGRATLKALIQNWPLFQRSLVCGCAIEATGVSIALTAVATVSDGDVVMAPCWHNEEPWITHKRRLVRAIRDYDHPFAALSRRLLIERGPLLIPLPQACVTVVSNLGIKNPSAALGVSGGACPLMICAGTDSVQIVWDHRIYDPPKCARFYDAFFPSLEEELEASSPSPLVS